MTQRIEICSPDPCFVNMPPAPPYPDLLYKYLLILKIVLSLLMTSGTLEKPQLILPWAT